MPVDGVGDLGLQRSDRLPLGLGLGRASFSTLERSPRWNEKTVTLALIEVARQHGRRVVVAARTDTVARAAGALCGARGTADVIDASVALAARRHRATVISSERTDLQAVDPAIFVVEC